ncbi:energy-coupled thiamine transporter ThiT [Lederbergia citrea]|uniref:energy-coupled thiamine transporter ThiT n=1 Tax=Lederbergia citrea TaxID=2833581 RepID=UPI001BC9F6BA|nr:energy-coupled thiamine transporter ThiT [Lederbergia citrea]MBS4176744.1 energy-coupled thiamine transporter ThiT [Lederbergia citrea]MBS4203305.1 energy-coupled thiamine transporter ThiT [Lederbergia citrea]
MGKISLQAMIEAAIFAAMALVLDLLPSIKFGPSISISFAMVPVFIVAFRWGVKAALFSGLLWSLLQFATGDAWILTPIQAIIDYPIAFSFIGLAGMLAPSVQKMAAEGNRNGLIMALTIGIFIGSLGRYFWHFISGVVFFGSYAKEAGKTPIVYSFVANGITMFFSFLACTIVLSIILAMRTQLLKTNKTTYPSTKSA